MPHDPATLCDDIQSFCRGKRIADFATNRQMQLAVERGLEIIGEAMYRIRVDHLLLVDRIHDAHKTIGMRNILAHGYGVIDHDIIWDAVANKLPLPRDTIVGLSRTS